MAGGLSDANPIALFTNVDRSLGYTTSQNARKRGDEVISLTPLQKLPWELLSTIFRLGHQGDHSPSPAAAPLLLCTICARWR